MATKTMMQHVPKVEAAIVALAEQHGASAEGGNIFYVNSVAFEAGVDARIVGMTMMYAEATLRERWLIRHQLRVRYVKQGRDRMFYVNAVEAHPDSPLAHTIARYNNSPILTDEERGE
jgi:hypothetical protein